MLANNGGNSNNKGSYRGNSQESSGMERDSRGSMGAAEGESGGGMVSTLSAHLS